MKYVLRRVLLCALVSFSLAMIGCGKTNGVADLPVPNGTTVQVTSDYPSVVEVILPNGSGLCTGTFISPRAVLTAAHCALTSGAYTVIASFGSFTTSSKVKFGVGSVDDPNDIAILYFDHDIATAANQSATIGNGISTGGLARLTGFGCNDIDTRTGSGIKRTGTNVVYSVDDYVELLSPQTSPSSTSSSQSRGILGYSNRAASCYGDSGGALSDESKISGKLALVGVTHAGGTYQGSLISQFVDLGRSDNRNFISQANQTYSLGITGL